MNKIALACAALAVLASSTLSAHDAEAKVVAIDSKNLTVTVASPVIEGEGGRAVVRMESIPAGLKVGSPVVVRWRKDISAFVIVRAN